MIHLEVLLHLVSVAIKVVIIAEEDLEDFQDLAVALEEENNKAEDIHLLHFSKILVKDEKMKNKIIVLLIIKLIFNLSFDFIQIFNNTYKLINILYAFSYL